MARVIAVTGGWIVTTYRDGRRCLTRVPGLVALYEEGPEGTRMWTGDISSNTDYDAPIDAMRAYIAAAEEGRDLDEEAIQIIHEEALNTSCTRKVVDESSYGRVVDVKIGRDDTRRLLRVIDTTTGDPHWLRVPPEMKTAQEAVAWTFGMTAEEYAPTMET